MKLDSVVEEGPNAVPVFNVESFKSLLMSLLISKNELDIDLLLMLKEEVPYIFIWICIMFCITADNRLLCIILTHV